MMPLSPQEIGGMYDESRGERRAAKWRFRH
jgi:hypothetical protein